MGSPPGYTVHHQDLIDRLILVDALGLAPLSPTPEFSQTLEGYLATPTRDSHDHRWRYCTVDLGRVRGRMGGLWEPFTAANLDRLAAPGGQAAVRDLMAAFGTAAIPAGDLARITVPTTLIWGRDDLPPSVEAAEAASARYGWLHILDDCADDPVIEQPEAFLRAVHVALGRTVTRTARAPESGGAVVNYQLAYAIGFHQREDAEHHPPFAAKASASFHREEQGLTSPTCAPPASAPASGSCSTPARSTV